MIDKFNFIIPEGFVLVLRTVKPDMSAYGGFVYPTSGKVSAPDWDENPECGNGLHGWLWGEGDDSLAIGDEDTRVWMILLVKREKIVSLNGKVKFPEAEVVYCGDCETAVKIIQRLAPAGTKINRSTNSGGDGGSVVVGEAFAKCKAGIGSLLVFRYYCDEANAYRLKFAEVDGYTIRENVFYTLSESLEIVEACK